MRAGVTGQRAGFVLMLVVGTTIAACSESDGGSPRAATTALEPVATPSPSTTGAGTAPTTVSTPASPDHTAATTAPTTAVIEPAATFEQTPCEPAPSEPDRVTCGYLEVPERHSAADGPSIRVAVAIVDPSGEASGPEPVVFLAGGPGFGSVASVELMLANSPTPRTVVLVDYRGVGRSQPSLECTENDDLQLPSLGKPAGDPAVRHAELSALQACHDRLVASGVDIAAYNYEEIAADLDALRGALGYDRWDLWGLSNGGRVALEVVRRYPDGVRSLVLDAPSPPHGNLQGDLWPNAAAAFEQLFERCAADPACGAAYPDLATTYEQLASRLATEPVEVVVPGAKGGRPDVSVLFTETLALNALREAMYDTGLIPILPYYISELAQGRGYDAVAQLVVDRSADAGFSDGMAQSVNCREEIAFLPDDYFDEQAEQLPLLAPTIRLQTWIESCRIWDVGQGDPSVDEPVVSPVPALILVGEFDPVHPPTAARSIRDAGLSNATVVEVPGVGHGTLFRDPCPMRMLAAFLDDPESPVDTSCVAEMPGPAWVVP